MSCQIEAEKIDKRSELESLSFAKAMKDTKSLKTHTSDRVKVTEVNEVSMKVFICLNMLCSQDERQTDFLSLMIKIIFKIHRYNSESFL